MRGIVIGLCLLATLFGAAWIWQERVFDGLHGDLLRREEGRASDPEPNRPPGWGAVLVGGAAGPETAVPMAPAPRPAVPTTPVGANLTPSPGHPTPPPRDAAAGERQVAVGSDQSLWSIVRHEYGQVTAARVAALAAYNGLADPDLLARGQLLVLPTEAVLASLAGE